MTNKTFKIVFEKERLEAAGTGMFEDVEKFEFETFFEAMDKWTEIECEMVDVQGIEMEGDGIMMRGKVPHVSVDKEGKRKFEGWSVGKAFMTHD